MQRELTGVPPLTFVSNGKNLVDYRIYGASGGVGDRTKNLFDIKKAIPNTALIGNGNITSDPSLCTSDFIPVTVGKTYFIPSGGSVRGKFYNEQKQVVSSSSMSDFKKGTGVTIPNGVCYVKVSVAMAYSNSYQIELGSIATDYEPYGCKIPIICGGTTTNIYLNEPLGENESISMNDTGVSIPTINGSNTLRVNTTVQPSSVYVKYVTNERSVPARTYLQGVEKMDNWAIYNYINREGSGALRNESTVTSTTVAVRNTIQVTGAASGGTGSYQYAFYYKRGNAAEWTTKSDYGAATAVDFSPYYVDTYKYKVNVKDSKGTIKSKIFNINVTAAASTTSNMPSLDKLSFKNTDELTVDNDFNRADLTVEDNTPEEV